MARARLRITQGREDHRRSRSPESISHDETRRQGCRDHPFHIGSMTERLKDMNLRILLGTLALVALTGCVPTYTLVAAGPEPVATNAFTVQPSSAWNRMPKNANQTKYEEVWTHNGPLLDTIAFIGGLPEGETLITQTKKE